jgi:sugar (pentulose or hexulose) kinase
MAGREFAALAGEAVTPAAAEIARVIGEGIMALPTFAPGTGPFGARKGNWSHDPAALAPGELTAAASLYSALMAETCLKLAGAEGPTIVEGPFSRNRLFLQALTSLTHRTVIARPDATGTTDGAAVLAFGGKAPPGVHADPAPVEPLEESLDGYAAAWREAAQRERN